MKELKESLWSQFGASIEMFRNAVSSCPDDYFLNRRRFYYLAYHSAILLDYYLTIPPKDFSPKLTFTIKEPGERPKESVGDMIPDKIYSKRELIDYIQLSHKKCKELISGLTDDSLSKRFTEGSGPDDMDYSILEILFYNMRHVQHHTGQLNLLIRQDLDEHVEWVFRADYDM